MEFKQVMAKMVQDQRRKNPEQEIDFDYIPSFVKQGKFDLENSKMLPIPFQLRYFSTQEVADIFQVTRRTVYRWAKKGWILRHRPAYNVVFYKGYELLQLDRFVNIIAK